MPEGGLSLAQASRGLVVALQYEPQGGPPGQRPHGELLHTFKTELSHHQDYQTRRETKADTFEYIGVFHRRVRGHSALGCQTPAEL